jgi:hypothetical protein
MDICWQLGSTRRGKINSGSDKLDSPQLEHLETNTPKSRIDGNIETKITNIFCQNRISLKGWMKNQLKYQMRSLKPSRNSFRERRRNQMTILKKFSHIHWKF